MAFAYGNIIIQVDYEIFRAHIPTSLNLMAAPPVLHPRSTLYFWAAFSQKLVLLKYGYNEVGAEMMYSSQLLGYLIWGELL